MEENIRCCILISQWVGRSRVELTEMTCHGVEWVSDQDCSVEFVRIHYVDRCTFAKLWVEVSWWVGFGCADMRSGHDLLDGWLLADKLSRVSWNVYNHIMPLSFFSFLFIFYIACIYSCSVVHMRTYWLLECIYIYIYMCVCVFVSVSQARRQEALTFTELLHHARWIAFSLSITSSRIWRQ